MKVAVLSESAADEAGVRVLLDALLGTVTEPVGLSLRSRGWPSVLQVLPKVLLHLHFHTDAEALAVVVDSNSSALEPYPGEQLEAQSPMSRRQQLCAVVQGFRLLHPTRPSRPVLRAAVGVAAPSIEAWYLCGRDPQASEFVWRQQMREGKPARERIHQMKQAVYGTDRPSLVHETERAVQEARRVAADLALLEERFPIGFGSLAKAVRRWREEG